MNAFHCWLLVGCTMVWVSPAFADDGAAHPQKTEQASGVASRFERLDANHDGAIAATEAAFEQQLWRRFEEVDLNGDGRLSRDEFERWAAEARYASSPALLLPPPR